MHRTSTMRLLAVAVGTIALASPAGAVSISVTAHCDFATFAEHTVTGGQDTFTGVAYGYAASDTAGATVTVRCELRVNGDTRDATPPSSGTSSATTAGQLTYTASDTDTVDLCVVWEGSDGSGEICHGSTSQQFPPQPIVDLLDLLLNIDVAVNQGDTGIVAQSVSETAQMLGLQTGGGPAKSGDSAFSPKQESHDLMTGCTYRYVRNTGVIQVVGKTKGGRHPVAQSVSIRCRLEDAATGTLLFDQTRTEPGTIARLEATIVANPNNVRVCNLGVGWWDDGDVVDSGLSCQ